MKKETSWCCCLSPSLFVQLIHMTAAQPATATAAAAAAAPCLVEKGRRMHRAVAAVNVLTGTTELGHLSTYCEICGSGQALITWSHTFWYCM